MCGQASSQEFTSAGVCKSQESRREDRGAEDKEWGGCVRLGGLGERREHIFGILYSHRTLLVEKNVSFFGTEHI